MCLHAWYIVFGLWAAFVFALQAGADPGALLQHMHACMYVMLHYVLLGYAILCYVRV